MKYHELDIAKHAAPKRKGRGIAAGLGKTGGRGTKGQKARGSGKVRPGFEGGQNPLTARLPKLKGFKTFKPQTQEVTLAQLNQVSGKEVDPRVLAEAGVIRNAYLPVKLIATGELMGAKNVSLTGATAGARKAVEAAGGTFTAIPRLKRESSKQKTT